VCEWSRLPHLLDNQLTEGGKRMGVGRQLSIYLSMDLQPSWNLVAFSVS
jgi:hypothetical protein